MKTAICTLFEGDYHLGLAALVNSLEANGFKGDVFAGYRGSLIPWMPFTPRQEGEIQSLEFSSGIKLSFVPLQTNAHFTNYKPFFMQELWAGLAADADTLVYVDPDLLFNAPWGYFEDALRCGVLLCEDVNSPLHRNHPRRVGWRRELPELALEMRSESYVNGGFVSIPATEKSFLERWIMITDRVSGILGGSDIIGPGGMGRFSGRKTPFYGFADCFSKTDQDALNITVESSRGIPFSILGRDAMGFAPGESILPHALGIGKPWRKNYLLEALKGYLSSSADRAFWYYADHGPLRPFQGYIPPLMRFCIKASAFFGRFYSRK